MGIVKGVLSSSSNASKISPCEFLLRVTGSGAVQRVTAERTTCIPLAFNSCAARDATSAQPKVTVQTCYEMGACDETAYEVPMTEPEIPIVRGDRSRSLPISISSKLAGQTKKIAVLLAAICLFFCSGLQRSTS